MVRRICEITVTLDFIFWLVLCSREDVSFNIICLNMLEGIKQFNLLKWFKKTRLETPFKGDNVKTLIKTSNCVKTWSFIFLKKFRKLQHLLCFFWFLVTKQSLENGFGFPNDQKYPRYPLVLKFNVTLNSTAAAFGNSVFFNGKPCQMFDACIFMTANKTCSLMWMGSPIQNNC